jgi:hypothetical protein
MKLLTLTAFSLSLFSLAAYSTETVSTICFFTSGCHKDHAKDIEKAINKRPEEYISHSSTSTKYSVHSIIVYK